MRKTLCFLFLAGIISVPSVAFGAEPIGIYAAPKFVYGYTKMDSITLNASFGERVDVIRFENRTDDTFGASIAIGYDFSRKLGMPFRAELEYAAFSRAEAKKSMIMPAGMNQEFHQIKQTFDIQTLFVNAYWDIKTGTRLTPYVGAGLGMGFIGTKGRYYGEDANFTWGSRLGSRTVDNFAWNVGAGLGYDITDNWTVDAGYRFVDLGTVRTGTVDVEGAAFHGKTKDLYQHQFFLGVRYTF